MSSISDLVMRVPLSRAVESKIILHNLLTVSEQWVCPFTFYLNGQFHQGGFYSNEVYGLIDEISIPNRSVAYKNATDLLEQGNTVLITVSSSSYRIWISLRSPNCPDYF